MIRVTLAALLAAVALFFWGFLFWGLLPFMSWVSHSAADEQAVADALKANLPQTGVYFLPYPKNDHDPEVMQQFEAQHKAGPLVQIIYRREGMDPMGGGVFAAGFVHFFLTALLVGLLLRVVAPSLRTYGARVLFVGALGLFAAVATHISDIIWFHHPWQFPVLAATYTLTNWLLAGAILGWLIKAPASASGENRSAGHPGVLMRSAASTQTTASGK